MFTKEDNNIVRLVYEMECQGATEGVSKHKLLCNLT